MIETTYEDAQREAKAPGVEERRAVDKARADLAATYQALKDDPRYTEEHKAQTAWTKLRRGPFPSREAGA